MSSAGYSPTRIVRALDVLRHEADHPEKEAKKTPANVAQELKQHFDALQSVPRH